MTTILELLAGVMVLTGAGLTLIGGLGLLRLPNFYTRIHAAGITDSLGSGLVLMGLLLLVPSWLVAVKLILTLGFLLLTTPVASHATAKAALVDPNYPPPTAHPTPPTGD
ncbi:MAG: monovalent cation/H(+) antiporter subunit G [Candidatus Competibacterales bacterium]